MLINQKLFLLHVDLNEKQNNVTTAQLDLLGDHWSAEKEPVGSNPGQTNKQGLKKTGEIMLAMI